MINVTQVGECEFQIFWDENDPKESILNDWKEEDFIRAIEYYLNDIKNVE